MMKFMKFFIVLLIFSNLYAQHIPTLVNYGPEADKEEGDDDFLQIIFVRIDPSVESPLQLNLFDMDCGGVNDLKFGEGFNSNFSIRFFGGPGVFSDKNIRTPKPGRELIYKGKELWIADLGEDVKYDNKWINVFQFEKNDGELFEGKYYFKLVVEGISGNDANVFDVKVTSTLNSDSGIDLLNFAPTVRLNENSGTLQLRFNTGENEYINIYNYDGDGRKLNLATPFRSELQLNSSGQGVWASDYVKINPIERNRVCAVEFGPGGSMVNDAVFYIKSGDEFLPVILPVEVKKKNNRPVIKYSINYTDICKELVFDSGSSVDPDGDKINYEWIFPKSDTVKISSFNKSYKLAGTYRVTLLAFDNSGCVENGSVEEIVYYVNEAPSAIAGNDIVTVPNSTVYFDASQSFDDDGWITDYKWDFGSGSVKQGKVVSNIFAATGRYKIVLTVKDNSVSPCNSDTDTMVVWVNEKPSAKISVSKLIAAANEEINFSSDESFDNDGSIEEINWDLGDGHFSTERSVGHMYSRPGKYNVSLQVKDNSGVGNNTSKDIVTIIINNPPVASAGQDKFAALNEELKFDATQSYDSDGSIIEYQWDFGDGSTSSLKTVTHSYSSPGDYLVSLIVKDNSGTSSEYGSDKLNVSVNSAPEAVIGGDIYQTDSKVTFDASRSFDKDGKIISYSWDFGDSSFSNEITPVHYYKKSGDYKVRFKVKDNTNVSNNFALAEISVKINARPTADAGPDFVIAPGETVSFSGSNSIDPDGEISSYEWTIADQVLSNAMSFEHLFNESGKYTITLKVNDNSGHSEAVDYDNVEITVNESPVIIVNKDIVVSPGQQIKIGADNSFDPDGQIEKFEWMLDNNLLSTEKELNYTFKESGIYRILLKVTDNSKANNSEASEKINVFVNNQPVIVTEENIFSCDKNITLSAVGTTDADGDALLYSWSVENQMYFGESINHKFASSGIFPVLLTVDDSRGLMNSVTTKAVRVIINTPPEADAGKDEVICSGDVLNLNGSLSLDKDGDLLKLFWDFGDGDSAEGLSVTHVYNNSGVYEVTLKVTDNSGLECNSDVDTKIITVIESPVAFAGEDIVACANSEVKFDGSKSKDSDGIVNNFSWDFGDGETGGGATPTHIYKKPGEYKVVLSITGELKGQCDNTDLDELVVTVTEAPYAFFESPDSVALGQELYFDAGPSTGNNGSIISYEWNLGDGTTKSGKTISHSYSTFGNYPVSLKITTDTKAECNSSNFSKSLNVNASPVAAVKTVDKIIRDESIEFDASLSSDEDGKIALYHWDFGDGSVMEGKVVRHSYKLPGIYNGALTVFDNTRLTNNSSSKSFEIEVVAIPEASIQGPSLAYLNQPVSFSCEDIRENQIYKWEIEKEIITGTNCECTFKSTGNHEIKLTVSDTSDGIARSIDVIQQILVLNNPKVKIRGAGTLCVSETQEYSAIIKDHPRKEYLIYQWTDDEGNILGAGPKIKINGDEADSIRIILFVSDPLFPGKNLSEDIFVVKINKAPVISTGGNRKVKIGSINDEVLFNASKSYDPDGDALVYNWNFGDGSVGQGKIIYHRFTKPGRFNVKLEISDSQNTECSSTTEEFIVEVEKVK